MHPNIIDPAVWGVALLCSWTISFSQGNTHSWLLLFQLLKKTQLQFTERTCGSDVLEAHHRCRSSLIWLLNSTSHLSFSSSGCQTPAWTLCNACAAFSDGWLSFIKVSLSLNPLHYNVNLHATRCCFGRVWSASSLHALVVGSPAGGALACGSFSTAEGERSLFFSFSDTDNIPSAGERAYQEASVKGRER